MGFVADYYYSVGGVSAPYYVPASHTERPITQRIRYLVANPSEIRWQAFQASGIGSRQS